jgi:hypothetical protein
MRKVYMRLTVLLCIFLMGCASTPPVPVNFDFARATVVAGDKEPDVVIDGLSGKDSGAAVGGAAGAGAGMGYAAIACLPAFMAYGACLAVAAPVLGGIGAAGGATVGAIVTENAADVQEKRETLNESLGEIDAQNYLATLISQKFQQEVGIVPLASETVSAPVQPTWTLQIALNEVSTNGSGGSPYSLQASATLEIFETSKEKTVIEYLLTTLASDMLKDLLPNPVSQGHQLEVLPLYTKHKPREARPGYTALLDPAQITGDAIIKSEK